MANLTIDATKVRVVRVIEQETAPAAVAISAGQWVRLDANGKFVLANATNSTNAGNKRLLATRTVPIGGACTALRKGEVDIGNALDALAFDAVVYLSDTAGTSADTAGTVSTIVGTVVSAWGATTADKLLRIDG